MKTESIKTEEQKNLKKAYWEVLFNGQSKLGLKDSELSDIIQIHYNTLNSWRKNKNKELPFYDLTSSHGIFVKQFMDLYINLRSLFIDPNAPATWIRVNNPALKDKTPLEFMATEENGIFLVNKYLQTLGNHTY